MYFIIAQAVYFIHGPPFVFLNILGVFNVTFEDIKLDSEELGWAPEFGVLKVRNWPRVRTGCLVLVKNARYLYTPFQ